MVMVMRLISLGMIATAAIPLHAHAQPAPAANTSRTDTARQYVNAGLAAQDSGDYDTAITLYTKAYQLVPHPVLLFNMAQAHRLAGHTEQALSLYAKYLAADPNGAQAQDARDRVAEIEARKAEEARKLEEARNAELARKAEDARKLQDARDADAQRARAREAAISPQPAGPTPLQQSPGRNQRIAGVLAGAVGAGALVVGAGFGLHADSLSGELSKPGAMYDPAKVHAGENANSIAIVGLVGGTALVAAGVALYWWGYREGSGKEAVTIAPMMADHVAGLVVTGPL
jgi:tetratricopeptide (TPR) repeat protein